MNYNAFGIRIIDYNYRTNTSQIVSYSNVKSKTKYITDSVDA